jgi:hypothetical protein
MQSKNKQTLAKKSKQQMQSRQNIAAGGIFLSF